MQAEPAIRTLLAEIDSYLGRLSGPGVADIRSLMSDWGGNSFRARHSLVTPPAAWLAEALGSLRRDGEEGLADAIADAVPNLPWITYDAYGRDAIGPTFADGHLFATIIGEEGVIDARDVDLGLFLVGPNILYRDHHHAAPELYAPLTGPHGWRFAPGDPLVWKAAHEPVWNEPFQPHATLTGDIPFLTIFGWTRDASEPSVILPSDDWAELEKQRSPRT